MPSRVYAQAVRVRGYATGIGAAGFLAAGVLTAALIGAQTPAQTDVSDSVLEKASEGRTVDIGLLSSGGSPPSPRSGGTSVATIPLEAVEKRHAKALRRFWTTRGAVSSTFGTRARSAGQSGEPRSRAPGVRGEDVETPPYAESASRGLLGESWRAWTALAVGVLAVSAQSALAYGMSPLLKPITEELTWSRSEYAAAMNFRLVLIVAIRLLTRYVVAEAPSLVERPGAKVTVTQILSRVQDTLTQSTIGYIVIAVIVIVVAALVRPRGGSAPAPDA